MNITNPNSEDLIYNLPDYVAGKITDENLINRIRNEITSNPEFRTEYELLSETYSTIRDLKFSEPPEHYFTNLVPEINEKILKSKENKGFTGIFRLSNLVKYALPAVSVILLIIIITYSNKNGKNENMLKPFGDTISDIMENNSDSNEEAFITEQNAAISDEDLTESDALSELQDIENVNIIEIFDENGDNGEEYFDYSEFESLSQIEQEELINTLSETKF